MFLSVASGVGVLDLAFTLLLAMIWFLYHNWFDGVNDDHRRLVRPQELKSFKTLCGFSRENNSPSRKSLVGQLEQNLDKRCRSRCKVHDMRYVLCSEDINRTQDISVEKISLGLLLSPNSRSSESPEAWHRKRNETLEETWTNSQPQFICWQGKTSPGYKLMFSVPQPQFSHNIPERYVWRTTMSKGIERCMSANDVEMSGFFSLLAFYFFPANSRGRRRKALPRNCSY